MNETPETRPPDDRWQGGRDRRRTHPAPRARLALMLVMVLGVLLAFTLLIWLALEVRSLTDETRVPSSHELAQAGLLFRVLAIVMSLSVIGAAIWIGHFAWRVRTTGVYPPPGSRHLRVRRVLRDAEARRVAAVLLGVAVVLALAGVTLVPLVFRVLSSLGRAPA
jgi:hypothetical protein